MRRKPLLIALAATVLSLAAPAGGAVASPTVRLAIAHVVSHCHVWKTSTKLLGPSTRITVARRTLTFRKVGIYRLTATNVQTPEERGLVTLGETNTLTLTVIVK